MKLRFTAKADKNYAKLDLNTRAAFAKQLKLLLENPRHPSLDVKKYASEPGVWQGRVSRSWRFYFLIERDEYVILAITPHPK